MLYTACLRGKRGVGGRHFRVVVFDKGEAAAWRERAAARSAAPGLRLHAVQRR